MSVSVLFFGHLSDITGAGPHAFVLAEGSTVQQLHEVLFEKWPALRRHESALLTAINMTYARREEVIPADAAAAIMPPVQGG
jgi:molybdopterin converting factor small subunit